MSLLKKVSDILEGIITRLNGEYQDSARNLFSQR